MIDQDMLNNHNLQLRRVIELDTQIASVKEQLDALKKERAETHELLQASIKVIADTVHAGFDPKEAARAYNMFG